MHELSIAMNIVDIANEYLKKANSKRILEIELEIGTLSGVDFAALDFALNEGISNTILKDSKKKIIKISAQAKCLNCSNEFDIDFLYDQCPECKEFNFEVIRGRELRVKSIVVD